MTTIKEILDNELINRIEFDDTNHTACIEFNDDIGPSEIKNYFGNDCQIGRCNSGNWGTKICTANIEKEDLDGLRDYSRTHPPIGNFKENMDRINRDTLPKAFK